MRLSRGEAHIFQKKRKKLKSKEFCANVNKIFKKENPIKQRKFVKNAAQKDPKSFDNQRAFGDIR